MSAFSTAAFSTASFSDAAFSFGGVQTQPDTTEQASNWQASLKLTQRPSEDELAELVRKQRIELGILTHPGQAMDAPADIATAVAEAVHDDMVMAEIPIDYAAIYRAAFLEAEHAITEHLKARRRRNRRTAVLLLTS